MSGDRTPLRGRRGRERRIATLADAVAEARAARAGSATTPARHRVSDLSALVGSLAAAGTLRDLADALGGPKAGRAGSARRHRILAGIPHGAKSYLAAALASATGERIVWIARDAEIADRVADELAVWLGDPARVVVLEPRTALPWERGELVRDEGAARVATLAAWRDPDGPPRILVAGVQALLQRTIAPADLPDAPLVLRPGLRLAQEKVLSALAALGYEHVPEVGGRGELARRGGILDCFPAGRPLPVRIEWLGDEIASIRAFDPADQRGVGPVDAVTLLPASELAGALGDPERITERLGRLAGRLTERLAEDRARLETGDPGDAAEVWGGILAPAFPVDHLGEPIVILDEPDEIAAALAFLHGQADERRAELEQAGELPRGWPGVHPDPARWEAALGRLRTLALTWEPEADGAPPGGNPFGWHEPQLPPAPMGDLARTIARLRAEGGRVVIATDQSARIAEILEEGGAIAAPVSRIGGPLPDGGLALVDRSLGGGFAGGPDGHVVLTDRELFGTVRVRRPRALRRVVAKDLLERLVPGDHVVHADRGIARYAGLVRRSAGGEAGEARDYLELHFAGGDRIWVAVEQIDRVSRYAGGETPQLSALGSGEWQRARTRVRKAVGDLAKDLLALYSRRAAARGRSFGEDTPWQAEMEAAFPYEETRDQLRAILEVKEDLERETPMDRLVVGDVGYGKTEVAIRAAFKAIQAGTQVAVLVPTTILAAQHFQTFRARFAAYPISVRMLSRFVPAAEQTETIGGLAKGSVDLVIGTHKLLGKEVRFRDLGLVIVDEEQRFGVAHKERLKQLRTEVHVLTLSATPIPRTLNLALAGIREMSVIETPPEDRLPIQTRVAEASAGLVRDAIVRELDRGGQVFYVHNRVETIEAQAEQLRRLLPETRIIVGHGQMAETELERVMLAFARGEAEVLVSTTIIESGLDIPNANTIVIDRADALGLAQLYQLRAGSVAPRAAPTPTSSTGGRTASPMSPGSASRRSSTPRSSGRASRSRSPTSRSAGPGISSVASSTGRSPRSASTSTRGCSRRRWRRRRRSWRTGSRAMRGSPRRSTCRWTPTSRMPTSRRSRTGSSSTGGSDASSWRASWPRCRPSSSTATDLSRPPWSASSWSRASATPRRTPGSPPSRGTRAASSSASRRAGRRPSPRARSRPAIPPTRSGRSPAGSSTGRTSCGSGCRGTRSPRGASRASSWSGSPPPWKPCPPSPGRAPRLDPAPRAVPRCAPSSAASTGRSAACPRRSRSSSTVSTAGSPWSHAGCSRSSSAMTSA